MVDGDHQAWDTYVRRHPDGTFCHLSGWRDVIGRAFGHATRYFLAERDGVVCGVLPLAQSKHLLFGNALISTPFCVYGGPLADDAESRIALEHAAIASAQERGVGHLEFRLRAPCHDDWTTSGLYCRFRKEIDPDPVRNLDAVPRRQRAAVRKGIDGGLQSALDPDVERLYQAYSESVRNLGTPVFSKRYFRVLKAVFGGDCEIRIVTRGDVLVAGVMSFRFRDEVLPYYGGGTALARRLHGNDFMYWEVMRHAAERGVRWFDFGRSKQDSGAYHFKRHWGFEPVPLAYEYLPIRSTRVPELNPHNPKYRWLIAAWKRLPLPLSRALGPLLSRGLG